MLWGASTKKLETTCREKCLNYSFCTSLPLKIHNELGQWKKETEEWQQEMYDSGSFFPLGLISLPWPRKTGIKQIHWI